MVIILISTISVGFYHNSIDIEDWGDGGRFSCLTFIALGSFLYIGHSYIEK
jgi:hypothetical protein